MLLFGKMHKKWKTDVISASITHLYCLVPVSIDSGSFFLYTGKVLSYNYIIKEKKKRKGKKMEFRKHINQRTNVQQIFQQIVDRGPISRRELQEQTGFSWGLISQVTNRLIAEGYVVAEDDLTGAGVGRRAEKLDIASNDYYFIGVDIDSDGMYAVVTDMKGRLVEQARHSWPEKVCDQVLQMVYSTLDKLMEKYGDKHITGIGVSTQGITDVSRGVSAYISRIKDWVEVPLRDLLSSRYGVDVAVVHDPDCLMESERAFGLLKDAQAKDVLLMHYNYYSNSIGMSVLIDGQIYFGHRGRAAELGYTIVGENADGKPRLLEEDLIDSNVSTQQMCNSVGKAIAVANTLFNPEIIVLHIPQCTYSQQLANIVEHWIHEASYDTSVSVKISKLEQEAKARGAALIMIGRAIDEME